MSSSTLPVMAVIGDYLFVVHNKNIYVYINDLNIWHNLEAGKPVVSVTAQPDASNNYFIYCLTEGDDTEVLSFNIADATWISLNVDENIKAITAVQSTVAQLLKNGTIEIYDDKKSAWIKIDEPKKPAPSAIASDAWNCLYKLYSTGALYKWRGQTTWEKLVDTGVASISAYDVQVFRADQDGTIYQFSNNTWTVIDSDQDSTTKVFAGNAGIYEIRPEEVYLYNGEGKWSISKGGKMVDMIVGEKMTYMKDAQGKFLKRSTASYWTGLPSLPK